MKIDLHLSRKLMWILFGVGLLLMALAASFNNKVLLGFGIGAYVVALLQAAIFYRCPHCGESLMNVRGPVPDFCPSCGETLDEKR